MKTLIKWSSVILFAIVTTTILLLSLMCIEVKTAMLIIFFTLLDYIVINELNMQ